MIELIMIIAAAYLVGSFVDRSFPKAPLDLRTPEQKKNAQDAIDWLLAEQAKERNRQGKV